MLKRIILFTILPFLILAAPQRGEFDREIPPNGKQLLSMPGEEDAMIAETFRIDIREISVIYNYFPSGAYVNCEATVSFFMRPGQTRPVIHLDPATRNPLIVSHVWLNGEELDFQDESDVRIISIPGTEQQAIEFQRDMSTDPLNLNTLTIHYGLPLQDLYPRFTSEVSDLRGRGNEERFPCINAPHELAKHHIDFRVHGDTAFRCIGSGLVVKQENEGDIQRWLLWTEQETASYSVMFALLPEADTQYRERTIDGVDVRIMAFNGGPDIGEAFGRLESWLPNLRTNLGLFPMPRGLDIFLVSRGGGMEYYGATITTNRALEHEIFHMYFGCSTVNKTYRDSWIDEALDEWYEYSAQPPYAPISESYRSNIVSGRSAVAIGFDSRAYTDGSRIMEAVARALGGRQQMVAFLSYLHQNYSFQPFTTMEFLNILRQYSGVDMTARFTNWLYEGQTLNPSPIASTTNANSANNTKNTKKGQARIQERDQHGQLPDMTPPEHILKKYKNIQGRSSK